MTAMSPGCSRATSVLVRSPTRAVPVTPGSAASRGAAGVEPHERVSASRPRAGCATSSSSRACASAVSGVGQPGQHAGQLALAGGPVEHGQPGAGDRAVAGLLHQHVPVGVGRHLRQVGDDDDLGVPRQLGQAAPDLDRGRAADAGVDLVEDERRHRAGPGQGHLHGEHHPGQLAAGGAAVQRSRLGADVGREQELDLVHAGRRVPQPAPTDCSGPPLAVPVSSASCWLTRTSTRASGIASRASSSVTSAASRRRPRCARRTAAGQVAELGPQLGPARPAAPRSARRCRRARAAAPRRPRPGEHLVDRLAVLPGQRGQRGPALGDRREPGRVGLDRGGVRRHVGGQVGQQVGDLGQPVGELAGLRVVVAHALQGGAGRGGGGERVRARPARWTAPREPAPPRCAGCRRTPAGSPRRPARRPRPAAGSTASISPRPKRSRSASRARSRAVAVVSSSSRSVASRRAYTSA